MPILLLIYLYIYIVYNEIMCIYKLMEISIFKFLWYTSIWMNEVKLYIYGNESVKDILEKVYMYTYLIRMMCIYLII